MQHCDLNVTDLRFYSVMSY